MSKVSYASSVGNLMYVMLCTRLDIAQAVKVVGIKMCNPRHEQWRTVKWILRYLKESLDVALCYEGTNVHLHEYVDSNLWVM